MRLNFSLSVLLQSELLKWHSRIRRILLIELVRFCSLRIVVRTDITQSITTTISNINGSRKYSLLYCLFRVRYLVHVWLKLDDIDDDVTDVTQRLPSSYAQPQQQFFGTRIINLVLHIPQCS